MMLRDLTFFQLEILKELKFGPKYGLELIKTLNVSSGRLYPNLKRLEKLGLIEGKKRDNRIYYSLSEEGLQEFHNIFRWIADYILSIGVSMLDDYLNFIIGALDLHEGEKIFIMSKKRPMHPFLMRMGLQFIREILKKVTISGRIFMLKGTGVHDADLPDIEDVDLSPVTFVEDFEALPNNIVDKSCVLLMDPDEAIIKGCERITRSEIKIIGKLYSDFFIERCFRTTLDQIKQEMIPPFLIGFKKEELLKKLEEMGYENVGFSSWGGAFVASISL